jgi:integrase/recombinase XerD
MTHGQDRCEFDRQSATQRYGRYLRKQHSASSGIITHHGIQATHNPSGGGLSPTADADTGPQALRTAALIRLLPTTALRVDELIGADVTDLANERGHRVLRVVRKGGGKARLVIPAGHLVSLDVCLADRAARAGLIAPEGWRALSGPLLATDGGGRTRQSHLWELVRRLARSAGLDCADQLSPHSLRHTAITLALDAGVPLRDVQDYAGHKQALQP